MKNQNSFVLALYDFASKQEYIYRTSKIKEISGASQLLDGMYAKFIEIWNCNHIKVIFKKTDGEYYDFEVKNFPNVIINGKKQEADAQVLYEGGGNLLVLFKNKDLYINANKIISLYLLQHYPSLYMLSSCVDYTGRFSGNDASDLSRLFKEHEKRKNQYPISDFTAVTPMTQIDPMTFLPVTEKFSENQEGNPYSIEVSLSADRYAKAKAYTGTNPGNAFEEGLTAVIYIDGNGMGEKLKSIISDDYEVGVARQREFSENVKKVFVSDPIKKLEEEGYTFRKVIGGGDEITLICKAEDALKITKTYFDILNQSKSVLPDDCGKGMSDEQKKNTSCAGICVIHAKSPFAMAYELAEAACESAKKESRKNHRTPGNYFDFYYCRAGITADFDLLRIREQNMTGRPYAILDIDGQIKEKAEILKKAGRANVKALGIAAQKGEKAFTMEVLRVNAYLAEYNKSQDVIEPRLEPNDLKIVYDIAEFYDLWFANSNIEKEEYHAADN